MHKIGNSIGTIDNACKGTQAAPRSFGSQLADMKSGGSADLHTIGYRADIDGLRAIAVLSVVFFHLSRQGLSGGYVRAHMFFELSVYLITAIISHWLQQGRYSIVPSFYCRIARIKPALLLLMISTTA